MKKWRIRAIALATLAALLFSVSSGSIAAKPADMTAAVETTAAEAVPGAAAPADDIEYTQSPYLDDMDLPPLEERLPENPKLTNEMPPEHLEYEIGRYGGTLRTVTSVVDWDADVFVMNTEPLLNTPGILSQEVTGNILESYDVTEDQMTFTFYLRKGLRWSDGEPVTMEDFRFTIEDVIFNEQLTPTVDLKFRSGGKREGNPMVFEVVDDWTFTLSFDEPYGGFPVRMAIVGWVGYTDILKPAHALKKYHDDYATDDEKAAWDDLMDQYGIAKGEEKSWVNLFHKMDITNWELNRKESIGFPKLYPWLLTEATQTLYTNERNPYYHKVDEAGQQLPYIDRIESKLVADMEMVTLEVISGEVDFCRESAALTEMPLYRDAEKNGITAYLSPMHVTPTDILINQTWGGGNDAYREMVQDVRFRQALSLAIDRDELIDTIYYGFAEPSEIIDSTYDPDAAVALLEEMGLERGADDFFLQPDGQPFEIIIEHGAEAPDIQPYSELISEFWTDIGVKTSARRIDQSLVGNKQAANELQVRIIWIHTPLWSHMDWGFTQWGRLWDVWRTQTSEITITDEDGTQRKEAISGEEPPEEVQEFYKLIESLMQVSVEEASTRVYQEIKDSMYENVWFITPLQNVKQPLVVRSTMRNVTDKGYAIAVNFSGEQFWYDE